MMQATCAVRNCISQRLSTNNCTRIPISVTLLQKRINLTRSFCPTTIESYSVWDSMSLCCCFSSPGSAASVDAGFERFGGLRSGGRCVGVLQSRNAATVTSHCSRSFDLSPKLSSYSWKKPQPSSPRWRRILTRLKVECSSQTGANEQSSSTPSSVLSSVEVKTMGGGLRITFCPRCGGTTEKRIPDGEHELRVVCTVCNTVHYENPKMVVGCLVEHEDQILLCKRSIEPSYGYWTLPAGYMEIGESAAEGAARETWEEACADVQVLGLFAHLDIPLIGQCRAI